MSSRFQQQRALRHTRFGMSFVALSLLALVSGLPAFAQEGRLVSREGAWAGP